MFESDRKLAPEPQLSAYLWVLQYAITHIRMRIRYANPMPSEQLHDLMDSIHNIPEFLLENGAGGGWFVEENIKADLQRYDERWGDAQSQFSEFRLLDALQMAIEQMKNLGQYDKRVAMNDSCSEDS